jgi:antitoxin component YwqK of YwqJK toxin-antitoxin module
MKPLLSCSALFLMLTISFNACYTKTKVLARFSNGQVKAARHYKRSDSLNEIYITYYDNGKIARKEYWPNRHFIWPPIKSKSWYKSGVKQEVTWIKYKDTVRKFNASDSISIFKGLYISYSKTWYENGKLQSECYSKNGHVIFVSNNEKGDSLKTVVLKKVRPDGYDSIVCHIAVTKKGSSVEDRQQ